VGWETGLRADIDLPQELRAGRRAGLPGLLEYRVAVADHVAADYQGAILEDLVSRAFA
jgi:hypothetical protein